MNVKVTIVIFLEKVVKSVEDSEKELGQCMVRHTKVWCNTNFAHGHSPDNAGCTVP